MSERSVRTFCRVCEPACGLVATVRDGKLERLLPDREHPVTRGFACNKGLAGAEIHRDPDRLDFPLRRPAHGPAERVTWDAAIAGVADALRAITSAHGPNAVATYIGNPTAFNTLAGPAIGAFGAQLGSKRTFSSGTQDCANKFAGSEAVFGSSTIHPIPDLAHTDFLLVFGANPRVSHGSFISIADPMRALRDARKRGAKLYFVNPREIESAEPNETILIRPDTDLYFMAALLHELDQIGGLERETLDAFGAHVAELLDFAARYPAERAAVVTGVPADTVRRLAREMAAARGASVHMSTGVNMGRQGTLAYWLLHMLSFATGNLDRRGGNILSVGFYPAAKAGRRAFEKSFADTEFGRLRRGSLPGNLLADAILAQRNPVRALVVVAGNPLLSIGGEARMREALGKLELLVCIDLYKNATGEYAHWLLPSTDMFERADVNITGLGLQHEPWIQFSDAVVEPRGERREEWWIFARLAQALGFKSPLDAGPAPDLWGRIDHMLHARGHSLDALRAGERPLVFEPLTPGRFFAEQVQTPDGKVDCCPRAFGDALARAERICAELEAEGVTRLKLITRRDPYMHNSWYANVPAMKRGDRDRNRLYVHPDDARARSLADGAKARIWNEHGALELELAYDAGLMPGVVALTHGWGNRGSTGMSVAARTPGVNANALLPIGPESFEPLSSQAFMTGIPVELAPL
ncbi:MAG: molybdopterin-dependent oxidoreductase [Myxococcota bacterium]